MKALKQTVKKVWVFVVAAVLIAGGGVAMNVMLSSKSYADAGTQVVRQPEPAGNALPQQLPAAAEEKPEYTVIDQSKGYTKDKLAGALKAKGAPSAKLDSRTAELQATYVPGDKDLTAEQAAAYGAGVLKKVFAADLSGYTARAGFLRGSVPGSDTWTVSFDSAAGDARSYMVFMNSVNGTIINAGSSDDVHDMKNVDLNDSGLSEKGQQAVTGMLPKNVSISGCRVTASDGINKIGVPVLCELSDGTAYMVGLAGEDKHVANLYYFQNGYDGSLDKTINEQKNR